MKRLLSIIVFLSSTAKAQKLNIVDFGAVADGKTFNTRSIQAAIDSCSKKGGKVIIPAGVFITGTLYIKNNTTIHLEKNAVLKGGASFDDYPDNKVEYKNYFSHFPDGSNRTNKALLFAENVTNIKIEGKGTIDGNGKSSEFSLGDETVVARSWERPCGILFISCKQILVQNITLTNSAYWLQNYINCDGLTLRGLNIYNHANHNNDGMDIDSRNVLIENCTIDSEDDALCFKSHSRNNFCENIVVRNCVIASNCNAIKFGTTSIGGFKNINITNCTIRKASESPFFNWQKSVKDIELPITILAGIAIESTDGANIENINISNLKMKDVQTPIFIMLGNRGRKQPGDTTAAPIGSVKNISISNITAKAHSKISSSITAFPGQYVENIQLNNIAISNMGKGTADDAKIILPENPGVYPENRMYGQIYPASAFYIRHAKNITLNNIRLVNRNKDERLPIITDDVFDVKVNGLKLSDK
ncbi:MAG: glycosyl hydrolase family 28 protein [Bacteroidota bacterium]